jgi:hypothetical protein
VKAAKPVQKRVSCFRRDSENLSDLHIENVKERERLRKGRGGLG